MTVISAIFSKQGISVATDSMLAAVDSSGRNILLEWKQSKIIPIPKLNACISYWGFAGILKNIPKPKEKVEWAWQTYKWLINQVSNPKQLSLEDFSKFLQETLENQLSKLSFSKQVDKGIGLHITGIEKIDNHSIPELFLISNFTNPSYQTVGDLGLSRNTFHTIAEVPPSQDHYKKEFRFAVKDYLMKGGIINYNNGDPIMYNMVSSAILKLFQIAYQRQVIKPLQTISDFVPMVKRPIETISKIQRDFYKPDKILVGGKIHDYCIDNYGRVFSTSGDS